MTRRGLPIVTEQEKTAIAAKWPDPVLALSDDERKARVRSGADTVLLDDPKNKRTRGFVRTVLTVPLGHEAATVYGVFVEVDRAAYQELQQAYKEKRPARVRGRLATRLPHLEEAYESEVEIVEDGSEKRARIVAARHKLLVEGQRIGPV